jgi:Uma2 family endonuclease
MAALKVTRITPQEYLAREKEALEKFEFISGEILAMAGAKPRHNRISGRILTLLDNILNDSETCEPFNSDQKVRIFEAGPFFYPDVSVACEPIFDQDDCLRNPVVIVEVLSDSTASYDRGEKFLNYRQLPSLQEYVLVSQSLPLVEHYSRQSASSWVFTVHSGLDATVFLPSLSATLSLREIYRRISFDTTD